MQDGKKETSIMNDVSNEASHNKDEKKRENGIQQEILKRETMRHKRIFEAAAESNYQYSFSNRVFWL